MKRSKDWMDERTGHGSFGSSHGGLKAGEGRAIAWVITGCIDTDSSNWVTDVTGKSIAVPEAFFKAVLLRLRPLRLTGDSVTSTEV